MADPIHIKASRKGEFTRAATAHHMTPDTFDNHVLDNPEDFSEKTRKQAQFAENAEHWSH